MLTGKEVSFEAFLRDGIVRLELDAHVVVLRGDDFWNVCAAVLPMQLGVRGQTTPHLHVVVFTHLRTPHTKDTTSGLKLIQKGRKEPHLGHSGST